MTQHSYRDELMDIASRLFSGMSPVQVSVERGNLMRLARNIGALEVATDNCAAEALDSGVILLTEHRSKRAERFARRGAA